MNNKYYDEVKGYILSMQQPGNDYPFAIMEPTEEDICKIANLMSDNSELDEYNACVTVLGKAPDYIYFQTHDNKVIDNWELAEIARIVDNREISPLDYESLRNYKLGCKGILCEMYRPTVQFLLEHGQKEKAVQLYYRQNQGLDMEDARNAIEKMIQATNRR